MIKRVKREKGKKNGYILLVEYSFGKLLWYYSPIQMKKRNIYKLLYLMNDPY